MSKFMRTVIIVASGLATGISVFALYFIINENYEPKKTPVPIVSVVTVTPSPTKSPKPETLGFCFDGTSVMEANIVNGVLQCGSGYFVNVRPTIYKE